MSWHIWSENYTRVVAPKNNVKFRFNVEQDGRPAEDVLAEVSFNASHAASIKGPLKTASDGILNVQFEAQGEPEKVTFHVRCGDATRECTLFVTGVDIVLPHEDSKLENFSREEESLLRMLYWDKERIHILKQFGGGLSGSRVVQVRAVDAHGPNVTQIVKIGMRDSMIGEKENFKLLENRVAQATPVYANAALGTMAAIVYGDASATQVFEPVVPIADFFDARTSDEVRAALYAVLESGMRGAYRYYTVKHESYRRLLGKFLPENLVVSLDGGRNSLGVYRPGFKPPKNLEYKRLDAGAVERERTELSSGEIVLLEGVTISKMQNDDLNLEDTEKQHYKVKVRYDEVTPQGVSTGDQVNVLAKLVTDRSSRMRFAVDHCLNKRGGTMREGKWHFEREIYPDPIELLDNLLDQTCDIAWGTIHGDLHWENVMLEQPDKWSLIDYGLTGEGPILFDFVKLETYLRCMEISKISGLRPRDLLEFEQVLVDNPLGELPAKGFGHYGLQKAANAIWTTRRLAKKYCVDDIFDYWRLLFVYAIALTKYYPTEDRWNSRSDKERLDQSDWRTYHALAMALTLGRLIHWSQYSKALPKMRLEFAALGENLEPEPKKIAFDVGSRCEKGVIDHHFSKSSGDCTTSLVLSRPELFLDHLQDVDPSEVRWIVHEHPDFDCIASAYLAWHRLVHGFFPPGAQELTKYAREVDAGAGFLEDVADPERTPYALFQLRTKEAEDFDSSQQERYQLAVQYGWELFQYLCRLELLGEHPFSRNLVPHEHPFWRVVNRDRVLYLEHDRRRAKTFSADVIIKGQQEKVAGLLLDEPRSVLFKAWVRREGISLLVVRWPQFDKPYHRIVVSVPPRMSNALFGLGKELENIETTNREELGKPRDKEPRRWSDVDNADPWYDGRSEIHSYTIVDSPRDGTVIQLDEVVQILESGKWLQHTSKSSQP